MSDKQKELEPLIPIAAPPGSVAERHWDKVESEKVSKAAPEEPAMEPEPLAVKTPEAPEGLPVVPQNEDPGKVEGASKQEIAEAQVVPSIPDTEGQLSRPLREIAGEYEQLIQHIVEHDGEMGEEAIDLWRSLNGESAEKLENCGLFLRNLETAEAMANGQVEVFMKEVDRLKRRAKAKGVEVKHFRKYIIDQMVRMEKKKHEGDSVRLTVIKNNPYCDIIDDSKVPDEFCNVNVEMTAAEWEAVRPAAEAVAKATTDGFTEFAVKRTPDKKAIIARWKYNQEVSQTLGTIVSQSNRLGLY